MVENRDRAETQEHSHHHDHTHDLATASRTRLAIALGVTATVLVAEILGAVLTGSLALAADAGHMLVDSSGLMIALVAAHLMTRPSDKHHTWGWARSEVIAATLQAGMLLVICVLVGWEAIRRILSPEPVEPFPMLIVGMVGLIANATSIVVLAGGRRDSLNMRAAFLEVANDALGSVAVIVAALATLMTQWSGADSVASLFIAVLMAPRAIMLIVGSMRILMESTPKGLDLDEVRQHILSVSGVKNIHDLHATTVGTGLVALTAHVTVDDNLTGDSHFQILHSLQQCVTEHFPVSISHSTFQLDSPTHEHHEHLGI